MNYQENKVLWVQRIEDYHTSGLPQVVWCQKQQVKISALRYWLRKLKEEPSEDTSEWVQLKVVENEKTTNSANDAFIKIHVGTFGIEIRKGFDQSVLLDIVKTLSVLC